MRVRLTPLARRDLFAVWHHIADRSPSAADAVVRRIAQRYQRLSVFSHRGVARPDLHSEARMIVVERWVVLYRIQSEEVLIVRIVDGAQDLTKLRWPPE